MSRPWLIIGDGGHAKVVAEALRTMGRTNVRLLSRDDEEEALYELNFAAGYMAMGLGMPAKMPVDGLIARATKARKLVELGFKFPPIQHRMAITSVDLVAGDGSQVMAGAIIQPDTRIGEYAIINTGASIDHDCSIGFGAHICPGAVLCGGVRIGKATMVGATAVVLPGVQIGDYAIVGAGAIVTRDVPTEGKVIGVW